MLNRGHLIRNEQEETTQIGSSATEEVLFKEKLRQYTVRSYDEKQTPTQFALCAGCTVPIKWAYRTRIPVKAPRKVLFVFETEFSFQPEASFGVRDCAPELMPVRTCTAK